jgi:hypothetical protein
LEHAASILGLASGVLDSQEDTQGGWKGSVELRRKQKSKDASGRSRLESQIKNIPKLKEQTESSGKRKLSPPNKNFAVPTDTKTRFQHENKERRVDLLSRA